MKIFSDAILEKIIDEVIQAESSGDPNAISPTGAIGLMQIEPDTAIQTANDLGIDMTFPDFNLFDPKTNRMIGTAFFKKLLSLFGDLRLALAAYNCGPGRVSRLTQKLGDDYDNIAIQLPLETINYVKKITTNLNAKGVMV